MKYVIALLLTVAIGFFIFTGLYTTQGPVSFDSYGEVNMEHRVSNAFINKNVTASNDGVVYGQSIIDESGSANMVTSVVVNYRSFDTLGEVTVLFISALGAGLLLSGKRKRHTMHFEPSFILRQGARIVFGIIVVFGVYMMTHGHLTPGGGFPGGAVIAAGILLLYIADDTFRIRLQAMKVSESLAGSMYVIVGLLGIVLARHFLRNFLPTGIIGDLISGGIIPVVYILIGLKVGSELSSVVDGFLTEEVEG